MPQASDGLHDLMHRWFGSPDPNGPHSFLLARGWTDQSGYLIKPTIAYQPSPYEAACLLFLRDEWDYDFDAALWPYIDNQGCYHDHLTKQGIASS